jgi:hypothetical protein
LALRALLACGAAVEADRDLITDGDRRNVGTYGHHRSAAFMAQDARQRERQVPVLNRDVGVADAGSGDFYHHFIGCGILKLDLGESEGCAHFLHHCG